MPSHSASVSQFLAFSETVRQAVDEALEQYTRYDPDCPEQLCQAIRHSVLAPGKRLRPLLVLMAVEACRCDFRSGLPAAAAVELVHTYSLIHDDLPAMDDDDTRRGRPSCHAKYGEATAILAGDAILAQAFEILARDLHPAEVAREAVTVLAFAAGPTALVGGQMQDLASESTAGDLETLKSIHRRKTGALLLASLRLGAAVAQANDAQRRALDGYGEALGLAFQIVDDLLDWQGNSSALGKRAGKDQERGKLTFPGLLGPEESREQAEQLTARAVAALTPFGDRAGRLEALANYVLERNR